MDLAQKKLALFDALLSRRGLQGILNAAAEILGNPLFACDMGINVVAKSETPFVDDPAWSDDPSDHIAVIRSSALSGDFAKMYATDKAFISTNPASPHRYLASRVRDGGDVLGHIVVIEQSKPFEGEDVELLPLVCQVVAFELRGKRESSDSVSYGTLVEDLIAGKVGEEEARLRLARLGISLPEVLRVMIVDLVAPEKLISADYLRLQILRAFPKGMAIVHGRRIIHILDGSISVADVRSRLVRGVYMEGLSIGLSRSFTHLEDAGFAFSQADAAIRLRNVGSGEEISEYDAVAGAHLAELVSASYPVEKTVHPKLTLLEEFDAANGTDHVRHLHAYLFAGRSVAAAASALGSHKNSMYYRVRRLEELMDVDLSDERTCFLLQLSLALRGWPLSVNASENSRI